MTTLTKAIESIDSTANAFGTSVMTFNNFVYALQQNIVATTKAKKNWSEALDEYLGFHLDENIFIRKRCYPFIPNNWLKMHGYPKRRKGKLRWEKT